MMEKDERGTGDPAFECTAITYNARRVDECAKARRREQRRSRKDSARQMESNDRDTRAARRVVGKRLTPWRRPAPPDAAHASYLKELTHPSSQCRPKTTVTSSFLTRCLWNPSSLCSLYPPFFSLLSSAFDFLLYFFFLPFSPFTLSLGPFSSFYSPSFFCILFFASFQRGAAISLRLEFSMLISALLLISCLIVTRPVKKGPLKNKVTDVTIKLLSYLSVILGYKWHR